MTMKMLTTGLGMALTAACLLAQPAAADTLKTIRAELYQTIGLADYEALDASIVATVVPEGMPQRERKAS